MEVLSHSPIHPWVPEHTAGAQEEQNCPMKWGQGAVLLQGLHAAQRTGTWGSHPDQESLVVLMVT